MGVPFFIDASSLLHTMCTSCNGLHVSHMHEPLAHIEVIIHTDIATLISEQLLDLQCT